VHTRKHCHTIRIEVILNAESDRVVSLVQPNVVPLRMALGEEKKGPFANMVRATHCVRMLFALVVCRYFLPACLHGTVWFLIMPRSVPRFGMLKVKSCCRKQAKGLVNGFTAATLMFAPGMGAVIPPTYAEDSVAKAPTAGIKLPSGFSELRSASFFPIASAGAEEGDEAPADAPKPKVRTRHRNHCHVKGKAGVGVPSQKPRILESLY